MNDKMTREDWLVAVLLAAISTIITFLFALDFEHRQGEKQIERQERRLRALRRQREEAENLEILEDRVVSAIHDAWPPEVDHVGCTKAANAVHAVFRAGAKP